jgi:hypothetical protein
MTLPSLENVVFVIVLVLPGYVALTLLRWIAIHERKIQEYQVVFLSVFISMLIYGLSSFFVGSSDYEVIKNNVLLPSSLLIIFGLSTLFGVSIGLGWRFVLTTFYGDVKRGDCWDAVMNDVWKEGAWVAVFTTTGQEYRGFLNYLGGEGQPKEITIKEPTFVLRDKNWTLLKEVSVGEQMYFSEKDIARILFI